jgi:hypothetical protein
MTSQVKQRALRAAGDDLLPASGDERGVEWE